MRETWSLLTSNLAGETGMTPNLCITGLSEVLCRETGKEPERKQQLILSTGCRRGLKKANIPIRQSSGDKQLCQPCSSRLLRHQWRALPWGPQQYQPRQVVDRRTLGIAQPALASYKFLMERSGRRQSVRPFQVATMELGVWRPQIFF